MQGLNIIADLDNTMENGHDYEPVVGLQADDSNDDAYAYADE